MGPDLGIIEIVHWVTIMFPSLSEYTKIITPILVFTVSVIGIFSNILPEPGKTYPIPDIDDLDTELKDQGRIVYRLTRISRSVTIRVNKIISSTPYKWFHKTTTFCSNMINRLRGRGMKSSIMKITKPKPYKIDLDRLKDDKDRKDQ